MVRYQIIMIVLTILSVLLLLVGRCRGRREIAISMTRGANYLLIALAIVSRKSKKGVARLVGRATKCKLPSTIFWRTCISQSQPSQTI